MSTLGSQLRISAGPYMPASSIALIRSRSGKRYQLLTSSLSRVRFVSDFVIKRVLWFLTGTQAGCNQWVGELPDERLGRVRPSCPLFQIHFFKRDC